MPEGISTKSGIMMQFVSNMYWQNATIQENILQVTLKSAIGKAIAYTLNLWPKLMGYLEDGKYEIDNNLIENAIRSLALGRKNYLLACQDGSGQE